MVDVFVAAPQEIVHFWPLVKPYLDAAIKKDFFHDESTLKAACIEDRAYLFVAIIGGKVMGYAIAQIERMKVAVLNIMSLGGKDFSQWKDNMNAALTLCARHMGCKYIVANSSAGWKKFWPDFTAGNICYTKEIFA